MALGKSVWTDDFLYAQEQAQEAAIEQALDDLKATCSKLTNIDSQKQAYEKCFHCENPTCEKVKLL